MKKGHHFVCGLSEGIAHNWILALDCMVIGLTVPGFSALETEQRQNEEQIEALISRLKCFPFSTVSYSTAISLKKKKYECKNQNYLVQKYLLELCKFIQV